MMRNEPSGTGSLKIVFLTKFDPRSQGGLQGYLRGLSQHLSRRGHQVEIWASAEERSTDVTLSGLEQSLDGVSLRQYRNVPGLHRVARSLSRLTGKLGLKPPHWLILLRNGPISLELASWLRTTDADVICALPFDFLHMYYPLALRRPRPVLIAIGALHVAATTPTALQRVAAASSDYDHYVAFTQSECRVLGSAGSRARFVIIPPGIDSAALSPMDRTIARAELGVDYLKDLTVIGYVGRQASYKGIDVLLDATERLWSANEPVGLVIAGKEGRYTPYIESWLNALPEDLRRRVALLGEFDEDSKRTIYGALDVLVNLSTEESFGLVFAEAWAADRAVLAPSEGPGSELVMDGHTGLVVPPSDAAMVTAALSEMLDSTRRETMARNGREQVVNRYDWSIILSAWDELLSGISNRDRASSPVHRRSDFSSKWRKSAHRVEFQ